MFATMSKIIRIAWVENSLTLCQAPEYPLELIVLFQFTQRWEFSGGLFTFAASFKH